MFGIKIDEKSGYVRYAVINEFCTDDFTRVDSLPDGDLTDYKYLNGEFVFAPLPKPAPPETGDTAAEIARLKERINTLEQNAIYN